MIDEKVSAVCNCWHSILSNMLKVDGNNLVRGFKKTVIFPQTLSTTAMQHVKNRSQYCACL